MTDAASATTALPAPAAQASEAAVDAVTADLTSKLNVDGSADSSSTTGEQNGMPEASQESGDNAAEATADSSVRTVFQDPENFNVKHPLFNRWTLWFDNPSQKPAANQRGTKQNWGEDLHKVITFDSVEEFWGLYSHIIPPSELPLKANYFLFKEGIQPAWEDPANSEGGKWQVQYPRDKSRAMIDKIWLHTMLSAIGETLEAPYPAGVPAADESADISGLITGVLMAARPNFYRLAIWTRKSDDGAPPKALVDRLMDIGKHWKTGTLGCPVPARLGLGQLGSELEFQSHKESQDRKGKKTVLVGPEFS